MTKKHKGISLIELIIYIGVMAIVLVAITDLAARLVFAQTKVNKTSVVTENLNFAMRKISADVENATAITGSYPSNTLTLTVAGQQLIYKLNGQTLTLSTGSQPAIPITSSKVNISAPPANNLFTKITNGTTINSVRINLVVSEIDNPTNQQTGQTTILLRSK